MLTYSTVRHHTTAKSFTRIVFTFPPQHVFARQFPWNVLSKQRSCAPLYGILINTDVGNPTTPLIAALGRKASFTRPVGDA